MSDKRIEDIDTNFRSLELNGVDLEFRPAQQAPFAVSGFPWIEKEGKFCRLPQDVIPKANEGVQGLCYHTSGGMLRFRSDADAIAINAELSDGSDMSHMPRSGSAGFDLYRGTGADKRFVANVKPEHGMTGLRGLFRQNLGDEVEDWTIYFPLYKGVKSLNIGLTPGCILEAPTPLAVEEPVLFYGSSITQGGCASRPGNSYTAIIARRLDSNQVNWGFSGNGRGEPVMAETIASVKMSAFVLDYDHNAPTVDHLRDTHEPFFNIVRDAQPDLPIVIVSRCDYWGSDGDNERRDIIRATYENAKAAGDAHVYFVDGEILFGDTERDLCTVDGCHPNDIGFLRMADGITPALREALSGS